MRNNKLNTIIKYVLLTVTLLVFCIIIYAYNSGSCKIQKKYICNDDFCLYKQFQVELTSNIKNDIHNMILDKSIQKRVDISFYPENILNCALPNKKGVTISTQNVIKNSNDLIHFYENDLCDIVSNLIGLKLYPTSLDLPTSCSILIYENENDWINWHYDYNYYEGRFFTVLIPITQELTCTKFQFMKDNGEIISLDLTGDALCFEGNYLYHRASKLCANQKRIIFACQYVTDNSISLINKARIQLKDFAYTGKLF
jgi:hypothetical protein